MNPTALETEQPPKQRFKLPFFYGWTIVLITFTTSMITAGIGGYGLSFFVIPMAEDLGISRAQFSSVSVFRLALLPIVPLLGAFADRKHGPRVMLTVGAVAAGGTLMFASTIQNLWQFYLLYGILFGLARMSMGGQLVGPAVVSKWFVRMRGRAMAIGTMGTSAGGFVIAPLAGWLVHEYGWRTAWVVLGLFLMLAIGPLAAFFMRRSPEDVGLLPDGDSPTEQPVERDGAPQAARAEDEFPWTVRQAMRTRALWRLLGVQTLGGIALSPVLFHQVAYVQDKDFSLGTATAVATTVGFFAIVSKLPWGYLSERVNVRWVVAACVIPSGLSLWLLVWAHSLPLLYAYAVLHGLTMGGWITLMNVAWASYFGRQHVGAIRGAVAPAGNIVGAFSPLFAGWMWDLQGSYDLPFMVFGMAWILAGLLMLVNRHPTPPA